MTDLIPTCALGGADPMAVSHGPLRLTERPDVALASLAVLRGGDAPDLPLPDPGCWAAQDDLTVFWTGPDQWLVEAVGTNVADGELAARLHGAAPGWAVTDQTDGWVRIDVAGPVDLVLERCVNLPADQTAPGRATRTVIDHIPVYLVRRDTDDLSLWGMRSAAESLWHALDQIAARIALGPPPG